MQLLAAKFNQIATAIETTNAQIAALQAKLSELQEHQQQLLSVEQACQSALAQVGTALAMLNHVDPAEIGTFKVAIDTQFGTDAIAFLESATPTPAEAVDPEPIVPTAPEPTAPEVEPVIDVEVATITDTPTTDAPIEPVTTPTPAATADIEKLLNKMTIQNIRKLAAAKKVSGNGTRAAIAGRLKAIVTQADIWNATA
jgi:CBS domain-containing protein